MISINIGRNDKLKDYQVRKDKIIISANDDNEIKDVPRNNKRRTFFDKLGLMIDNISHCSNSSGFNYCESERKKWLLQKWEIVEVPILCAFGLANKYRNGDFGEVFPVNYEDMKNLSEHMILD